MLAVTTAVHSRFFALQKDGLSIVEIPGSFLFALRVSRGFCKFLCPFRVPMSFTDLRVLSLRKEFRNGDVWADEHPEGS